MPLHLTPIPSSSASGLPPGQVPPAVVSPAVSSASLCIMGSGAGGALQQRGGGVGHSFSHLHLQVPHSTQQQHHHPQRQRTISEEHKSYYAISTAYVYGQEKYLLVSFSIVVWSN